MILYFSRRCCGEYIGIPSRPELLFSKANIMMTYTYAPKADIRRFMRIVNSRKRNKKWEKELKEPLQK